MEAVAVERAFPRVAVAAAVKQVDAAMRAVIHFGMLEVQRAFAAGTDAFDSALLGAVIVHLLLPLVGGQCFFITLAFEVAVHGDDGVAADQYGHQDADRVAYIAAVAGQVGDEFDEKGKQGEIDEAPNKRPPARAAFFGEQVTADKQQRQGEGEAVEEDLQFDAAVVLFFEF